MWACTLVLAAGGAALGYVLLVTGWEEPAGVGWPLVIAATALEVLFWVLLFVGNRGRVEQRH